MVGPDPGVLRAGPRRYGLRHRHLRCQRTNDLRAVLRTALPDRRGAVDAVLGRVLPDRQPRRGAGVARPAHPALARGQPVADALSRHDGLVPGRDPPARAGCRHGVRVVVRDPRAREADGGLMADDAQDRRDPLVPLSPGAAMAVITYRNYTTDKRKIGRAQV